jgi:hypothetical protein
MSTKFTSTVTSRTVPGASYMVGARLVGPTSYSTGGVPVAASLFNFGILEHVIIQGVAGARLNADWDDVNKKIVLSYPTGGATAPATIVAPVAAAPGNGTLAVTTTPDAGSTTMTGSVAKPALAGVVSGALAAPALTAGVGKEVAASTDVSSVTIKVLVFGR